MKYLSFLFALWCAPTLMAQVTTAAETTFNETTIYASQVTIAAAPERVIDLWDQFWDDKYDVDVDRTDRNRDREVYKAEAVTVPAISAKQIDLYSKITTTSKEQATVSLGVGLGYDVYATPDSYNREFQAARDILEAFDDYFYRKYYQAQLEEAQDAFDDAQDEVSDLQRDLDKSDRRIERWTKKIEDEREETAETRTALIKAKTTLEQQEQRLKTVTQQLNKWKN